MTSFPRVLRRPALLVVALLLAILTLGVFDSAGRAGAPAPVAAPVPLQWSNPVLEGDFPDPSVLRVGQTYWAATTSSAFAPGFPLLRSDDLVHWKPAGTIFPQLPTWATSDFWAPELVSDGAGGVRVLYTARRAGGTLCVAMAHASAPEGPYVDQGPLVCDRDGSIDATQYNDDRGRPFLIWKEDGNSAHSPSRIWVRRMRADGTGLIGPRHELLRNQDRWEGGVVEAPHVVAHDGWLYLFYSGNTYGQRSCHYAVGVARARTLLGPWQRAPRNPIVHSNGEWRCPGHSSSVDDGMGNQYLLYHGYRATDRRRTQRVGLLDRITWTASGWPQINGGRGPSGSSTTVAPPAPPAAPAPPATAAPAAG